MKSNNAVKKYYAGCHDKWDKKTEIVWKLRALPSSIYQKKRLIDTVRILYTLDLGTPILDAPCGDGYVLMHLPMGSIGIDIDKHQAGIAQKRAPKSKVVVGDMEKMKFTRNYFTAVITAEFFEHVPDASGYIRELWRVLKKDGLFVVTVPKCHFLWKLRGLASPIAKTEPQCLTFTEEKVYNLFSGLKYKKIMMQEIAWGLNYLVVIKKL
ncbi:class I SAM-dependent methyltransferase [Candidatus Woesebacteria bacterium]|nr:MAG: class I SAM-dependent methyltransferase [Candidatus Woesebacteria bacterium]